MHLRTVSRTALLRVLAWVGFGLLLTPLGAGCGSSTPRANARAEPSAPGVDPSGEPPSTGSCGAYEPEDGFVEVGPDDAAIRYVGRFDFEHADGPRMAFPATRIEAMFSGDALDVRFDEGAPGTSVTSTQYYEVQIDDGEPMKLETCPAQEVYPLARDLPPGEHRVRISKRTEASVGSTSFVGFRVRAGSALSPPAAPARRIEVVGDSITCGYGNEVSTTDPDSYAFTSTNENALLAYGAIAARALGADYVAVAASGRGMVRNYGGGSGLHAPAFYELVGPDSGAAAWDHSRYRPDAIVVNLGTNDFSIGLEADALSAMRDEYRTAYADFLTRLRELHGSAALIAAVGPMMSDTYPPDYAAWSSIRSDVRSVVDERVGAGDDQVYYFEFTPQSSPYGEDWHPTVATHQTMADSLVAFIRTELDW